MNEKAYIFGQIEVKDHDDYLQRYGMPFAKIIGTFNGKVLAATKEGQALEGERYGNWTVLLEFPSKEDALNFVTSEEYRPLAKLRVKELTTGNRAFLLPAKLPF